MSIFSGLSTLSYFEVDVTEPTKSYSGFTVYRVVLKLFEDGNLKDEVVVWKRYSEFRKLYAQLQAAYDSLHQRKSDFPLFAKRKLLGRYASDVIEERRRKSLQLLKFALRDQDLVNLEFLKLFFDHGTHRSLSVTTALSLSLNETEHCGITPLPEEASSTSSESMTHLDSVCTETVWSHRQPTPDALEAAEADENDSVGVPTVGLANQLSEFILEEEQGDPIPSDDVVNPSTCVNGNYDTLCQDDTMNDINQVDGNDIGTESSSNSENEVSDTEGGHLDRASWLRHAMSVCSEGEDIEQLASEGDGITLRSPPLSPRGSVTEASEHVPETNYSDNIDNDVPEINGKLAEDPNVPNDSSTREGSITSDLFTLDERLSSIIQDTVQQEDYVYHASVAMSDAIEHEVNGDFKSAFQAYKFGIGILLHGVQQDTNHERREAVRRKTASYLLRAENVYHLQHSQVASIKTSYSSPTSTINSLPQSLHDMKVLGILDKVMLVSGGKSEDVFVVKVLHKNAAVYKQKGHGKLSEKREKSRLLNCKYMVKILSYSETSNGVYLVLQHVAPGLLWDHLGLETKWATSALSTKVSVGTNTSTTSCQQGSAKCSATIDEKKVRLWAAEIFVCIFALHKESILCRDLNPRNILLDESGHILLTHFSNIRGIDYNIDEQAVERLYAAPEVGGTFEVSESVDYWSAGALIFEMLTGQALHDCHPTGLHSHSIITLPRKISGEAHSLLKELLRFNPDDRLGSGRAGVEEVKCHPFFRTIDWSAIM